MPLESKDIGTVIGDTKAEIKEAAGDGAAREFGFLILSKRLLWD